MSNSRFNASFSSRRRNFIVDTLAGHHPTTDGTISPSPTLLEPDIMVPVEAVEDVVSCFLAWLHEGKGEWPRFQDQRDQLSQGVDGRRDHYYTTRDIQERDGKIEEQRARIKALEAEVALLKQAQVETANDHEEQDMATMEDLDDAYQMLLEMERDVKESEVTRLQRSAEYIEERERYVALEAALEAERQVALDERPRTILHADYELVLVRYETEQELRKEVNAVRAEVSVLRAEMHAMKADAEVIHVLAKERDSLQVHVQTLEKQLRRHELLAAEVRKIDVAEIARLTSERDKAQKAADQYARELEIKNSSSLHSRVEAAIRFVDNLATNETTASAAKSSSLKEAFAAYRSLAMGLVDSLSLELDLVREQKTKTEKEKAIAETKKMRLKEQLREAKRCRQDDHELYRKQFGHMNATITRLRSERNAAIDALKRSDTTLVDIPSQAVVASSIAWECTHERTATIKASAVNCGRLANEVLVDKGQRSLSSEVDLPVVPRDGSEDGWTTSSERSFGSSDLGGTSTPPPKSGPGGFPEGQLPKVNSTDCRSYSWTAEVGSPGPATLAGGTGSLCTSDRSALSHSEGSATRTAAVIQEPSNGFLPPSCSNVRAFEPP